MLNLSGCSLSATPRGTLSPPHYPKPCMGMKPKPQARLLQANLRLHPFPPAVRAEAHQRGMVQLHIGSHAAVLPLWKVLCAPDADSSIICTGGQVFAIAAKVHARYVPTVALGGKVACVNRNPLGRWGMPMCSHDSRAQLPGLIARC